MMMIFIRHHKTWRGHVHYQKTISASTKVHPETELNCVNYDSNLVHGLCRARCGKFYESREKKQTEIIFI